MVVALKSGIQSGHTLACIISMYFESGSPRQCRGFHKFVENLGARIRLKFLSQEYVLGFLITNMQFHIILGHFYDHICVQTPPKKPEQIINPNTPKSLMIKSTMKSGKSHLVSFNILHIDFTFIQYRWCP